MTLRRTVSAVAVALLVVSAGCAGMLTEDADEAETTTSPSTATTTATTDADEFSLPAGVSEAGLANASALLRAHNESLRDAAYRVHAVVADDDRRSTVDLTRGDDASALRVETDGTTIRGWQRGQRTALSRSADGDTAYRYVHGDAPDRVGFEVYADFSSMVVATYLEAGDFETAGVVTRDGTRLVELTATEFNRSALDGRVSDDASVESFEATALVDEDGVVRHFEADIVESVDGETANGSLRFEVTDVGSASPEEPEWLGDVPRFDATVTDAGALAVEHVGGPALDGDATLAVSVDGSAERVAVPEGASAGDSLYVYVAETDDGESVVRAGLDRPSADEVATDLSTVEEVFVSATVGDASVTLAPAA